METRRISALLNTYAPFTWPREKLEIKQAFCRSMKGKIYTWEFMLQAWDFFVQGWKSAGVQNLTESVSQINTDPPLEPSVY
jgi:hypothetical protein